MIRRPILALLLVALPLLSGCTSPPPPTPSPPPSPPPPTLLPDLSDVPPSPQNPSRAVSYWEEFVHSFPKRQTGSPTNRLAAEALARSLGEAGFETFETYYLAEPLGVGECVHSPLPEGIRVVAGVKWGTTQKERVLAWVSHYDVQSGTIYGAYDDGSGTAVGVELARMFSHLSTRKTLLAIFFDAEELGLVASRCFVEDLLQSGADEKIDLVVGHDMVGINWPGHSWPMYQMMSEAHAARIFPLLEELYYHKLGLDPRGVVLLNLHDRNSDERRFKEAGIPILRMAGGRNASDYPQYHKPGDTTDYVYDFVGGRENFEKGIGTVLLTTYWSLQLFDRISVRES